ncbi:hypothetical protein ACHAXR_006777, partial [Thalassiosira sp. AJA248-18]
MRKRPRVVVAMSGGVDSSVAAHLLQQQQQRGSKLHRSNDAASEGKKNDGAQQHEVKTEYCDNGVDVIGLHMSNWNALDEDSDESMIMTAGDNKKSRNTNNGKRQTSTSPRSGGGAVAPSSSTSFCQASEKEYNDALSVAQHLSMPLHRVSFASEYWIQVFEPFVESLASSSSSRTTAITDSDDGACGSSKQDGTTTPNPDFGCNTYIKFGAMKEYAMDRLEADYVATGHYARLWHRDYNTNLSSHNNHNDDDSHYLMQGNNFYEWIEETSRVLEQSVKESIAGRPEEEWMLNTNKPQSDHHASRYPMLIAGADRSKDQTYFLSGVKSEAFRNVIFPLGHLAKSQGKDNMMMNRQQQQHGNKINQQQQSVRDIAHEANIPTASKRDSMGICFIGKRNFGNFVSQYLPEPAPPGDFIDIDTGEIVGRHEGSMYYTIGQGAKISGVNVRYFVCGKGGSSQDGGNYSNST